MPAHYRRSQACTMPASILQQEALTRSAIGAFYDVYNCLGFGFLEHLYLLALEQELRARGHLVIRELGVQVHVKGFPLGIQRLDMVVDSVLVIEAKSTYHLAPDARRQLCNHLRATNLEIGLLLHFGPTPKFFREIATNEPSACPPADRPGTLKQASPPPRSLGGRPRD